MWTADDMVDSVFLIYLKYIDNYSFLIRFKYSSTLFIQWGMVTYTSSPDGQVIATPVAFSTFFAGVVTDMGIKWNTGGTFSGLSYENNSLIFWPQYTGAPQTVSKNGTNYHWLIFCM